MSNPSEILPCPHCGGNDVHVSEEGEGYSWQNTFTVSCFSCETYAKTRAGAIELWNRRALEGRPSLEMAPWLGSIPAEESDEEFARQIEEMDHPSGAQAGAVQRPAGDDRWIPTSDRLPEPPAPYRDDGKQPPPEGWQDRRGTPEEIAAAIGKLREAERGAAE